MQLTVSNRARVKASIWIMTIDKVNHFSTRNFAPRQTGNLALLPGA
jgi:hypothetical protein